MNAIIGAIVAGQVIRQQMEEEEEDRRENERRERERRAKMTPEEREAEDKQEYEWNNRHYRNTEGASTKQGIILNKYLSGYAKVLPTGQIDERPYDSFQVAYHNSIYPTDHVSKQDVEKLVEEKKKALQMIVRPTTADRLSMWAEKWKAMKQDSSGLIMASFFTFGLPTLAAKAVSVCADKYIAALPENKGKTKDQLKKEKQEKRDDQKKTGELKQTLRKLDALKNHLTDSREPINFNQNDLPQLDHNIESYLEGRCTILPSGKVEAGNSIKNIRRDLWLDGTISYEQYTKEEKVSVNEVEQNLEKAQNGLKMIKPANLAERIVRFGEKLSDHFFTDVAGTLTILPKAVPAITKAILKSRNGTNKVGNGLGKATPTFDDRMKELEKRSEYKKAAKKIPELISTLKKNAGR